MESYDFEQEDQLNTRYNLISSEEREGEQLRNLKLAESV
jgi:hypothetical protein